MQKLENETLQEFLDSFINTLKEENDYRKQYEDTGVEINIPFIISSLYQSFNNEQEKYNDFINALKEYKDYSLVIYDSKNDYDGIIDVEIHLYDYFDEYGDSKSPNYMYLLKFTYDTRDYGYCECTPDMPDYRMDKDCCGHGCDASFCEFSLHKVLNIVSHSWNGDEHDYWEFEDEFYISDKELADKKREEDKAREIEELRKRIEIDQKRIAELEGE